MAVTEGLRGLPRIGLHKAGVRVGYSHAVILNPHFVIRRLYAAKTPGLTAASYNALVERAIDISADDMKMPLPEKPEEKGDEASPQFPDKPMA